jgi:hypothetical protein
MKNYYRVVFTLDSEAKELLKESKIRFTEHRTNDHFLKVIISIHPGQFNLGDDELVSHYLGPEFNEFLIFTHRVF